VRSCRSDLRAAYVSERSLLTAQTCGPAATIAASTPLNFSKFFTNFDASSAAAASYAGIGTSKTITVSGNAAASTVSPGLTRDFTFGTQFEGVSRFDTQGYFVPPSGTTEQRGRGRGLVCGGDITPASESESNHIDYITISTLGDAKDFGDLTQIRNQVSGGLASSTRGVFAGGEDVASPSTEVSTIDYVTISSTGNAFDFGDLNEAKRRFVTGSSDNTRGLIPGGGGDAGRQTIPDIQYITIASLGNTSLFGNLTVKSDTACSVSSPTRGIFGALRQPSFTNVIEFVTIQTLGDSKSFGDLTETRREPMACTNAVRAICAGGGPGAAAQGSIDYFTIATLGDAQDFGDLITAAQSTMGATSSPIRGVLTTDNTNKNDIEYVQIMSLGDAIDFGDLVLARDLGSAVSNGHGGLGN